MFGRAVMVTSVIPCVVKYCVLCFRAVFLPTCHPQLHCYREMFHLHYRPPGVSLDRNIMPYLQSTSQAPWNRETMFRLCNRPSYECGYRLQDNSPSLQSSVMRDMKLQDNSIFLESQVTRDTRLQDNSPSLQSSVMRDMRLQQSILGIAGHAWHETTRQQSIFAIVRHAWHETTRQQSVFAIDRLFRDHETMFHNSDRPSGVTKTTRQTFHLFHRQSHIYVYLTLNSVEECPIFRAYRQERLHILNTAARLYIIDLQAWTYCLQRHRGAFIFLLRRLGTFLQHHSGMFSLYRRQAGVFSTYSLQHHWGMWTESLSSPPGM